MYHILVVDDEKTIRESLKIYLEEEGYRVTLCENGRQALKEMQRQEVHLILLDVMMPEMDGMEAARSIRKISPVPILFLTAKSQSTDKIMGLNAGAGDPLSGHCPGGMFCRGRVSAALAAGSRFGMGCLSDSGISEPAGHRPASGAGTADAGNQLQDGGADRKSGTAEGGSYYQCLP